MPNLRNSGPPAALISVSVNPGETVLILMPLVARSRARVTVKPSRANLLGIYTGAPTMALVPLVLMLMMDPPDGMCGTTA